MEKSNIEGLRTLLDAVQDDYAALEAVSAASMRACRQGSKAHGPLCRASVNCEMEVRREVRQVAERGGLLFIVHPMRKPVRVAS